MNTSDTHFFDVALLSFMVPLATQHHVLCGPQRPPTCVGSPYINHADDDMASRPELDKWAPHGPRMVARAYHVVTRQTPHAMRKSQHLLLSFSPSGREEDAKDIS